MKQVFVNRMQVSFNLRQPKASKPTNVYLVCRVQGKQVKLSTGVKVYPDHWNRDKQEAYISCRLSELDNRNNEIANKKINELKSCFSEYKKYICDNPDKLTNGLNILREQIYKDNVNMKKVNPQPNATLVMNRLVEEQEITDSSKKVKQGHINMFASFLKEKNIPYIWDNMNLDTFCKYQEYLIGQKKAYKTIINNIATLFSVLRIANKRIDIPFKWAESNLDSFEAIKNKANKEKLKNKQVALTEEQLKLIYDYELTGNNAEKDTEIKDLFILQCLVGQRISDMSKFFNKEYTLDEKTNTISIIQQKTGATAIIPLLPLTKKLLNKYNSGFKYIKINSSNKNSMINTKIKDIIKEIGLTDTIHYQEQRGKEVINTSKPLYQLIHTHTARHTFITIMCRMGITKDIVIIATGHEDTTIINEVYEHLNEKDKVNKITNAFKDLDGELYSMRENNKKESLPTTIEPKTKSINILDYLFANKILTRLLNMLRDNINIFELPETKQAIKIIMNTNTIQKAKNKLSDSNINREIFYDKISKLDIIIMEISKYYSNEILYQIFQKKVIELQLSDKITRVYTEEEIGQIWYSLENYNNIT